MLCIFDISSTVRKRLRPTILLYSDLYSFHNAEVYLQHGVLTFHPPFLMSLSSREFAELSKRFFVSRYKLLLIFTKYFHKFYESEGKNVYLADRCPIFFVTLSISNVFLNLDNDYDCSSAVKE